MLGVDLPTMMQFWIPETAPWSRAGWCYKLDLLAHNPKTSNKAKSNQKNY
jgi:hypothetical protein